LYLFSGSKKNLSNSEIQPVRTEETLVYLSSALAGMFLVALVNVRMLATRQTQQHAYTLLHYLLSALILLAFI
jgi:hypothetical protein